VHPLLLEALADTGVVFVAGARQVGKTTLTREIASSEHPMTISSLDEAATRGAASRDPAGFLAALAKPALIDEIRMCRSCCWRSRAPLTCRGSLHGDLASGHERQAPQRSISRTPACSPRYLEPTRHGSRSPRERRGAHFAAGIVIHPREQTIPLGERLWALPIAALWA